MGAAFPFQNKGDQQQNYDVTMDLIYTTITLQIVRIYYYLFAFYFDTIDIKYSVKSKFP